MDQFPGKEWLDLDKRQRQYNLARVSIIKRMLAGEITKDQADAEAAEVAKQFSDVSQSKPAPPVEDERDDPWSDLGPQWGRRSSEDKIPAAAKAVTKHRTACGAKMSDKDIARFWGKINVKGSNECWPWKNSTRGSLGYGQFRIGEKICDAHRIALELMKGPLQKGRYILHDCDNPKCCNPRHLTAGTQKGNMDDMTEKGRGDN